MKKLFTLLLSIAIFSSVASFDEPRPLAIGSAAPDFNLPGVDGKAYTLASFKQAKILVVIFMCNHCPTSQAYENRVKQLTTDYAAKGVAVVAINPNNPSSLRLDELGYSDVGDSFEEMKIRAKDKGFNFPYLYDGATEITSRKFGPVCTPHVFIFDEDRKLRYEGRIDDTENPAKTPHSQDARNAIDSILAGNPVAVTDTKVFGCSIKWAEKSVWIEKAKVQWAKEPVNLDSIDDKGIKALLQNNSDKLRLINVWATWCGPCVEEFPEFVTMNHMYRDRGFEFVSISADDPSKRTNALKFLQRHQASGPNYIFTTDDKYKLIEAVDPKWEGALPYTILVEPGGKVVYAHQGIIDPDELKKIIFDDPMIGRVYKE
jgi:peroxiredoxin